MLDAQILKSAEQFRKNQLELCLARLQRLSIEYPKSVDCFLNLGTISLTEGKFDKAYQFFTKAVQIDPYDFRSHYNFFVLFWKANKQRAAYLSLRKCVSTLYALKVYNELSQNSEQDLNKSKELWPENTSSYVPKSIKLINEGNLKEASDVTKQALKNCHNKHEISAVCCIIDCRLNQEVSRQQNAKDYNDHLLRPLIFTRVEEHQQKQEIDMNLMNRLVQDFNEVSSFCEAGGYKKFNSHPQIAFMASSNKFSVDVGSVISKNLGLNDLMYIEEQKKAEDEEDEKGPVENHQLGTQEPFEEHKVTVTQSQQNLESLENEKDIVLEKQQKQQRQEEGKELEQLYPLTCASFELKLIMADLKLNQEIIGKMDPYVYFEYGSQKSKSGIAKGQGTRPRWQNQIKVFSLQKDPTKMKIAIYDKQLLKWDDHVGTGQFLIKSLGVQTIPIFLNDKQTGQVVIFISKKK